MPPAKLTIIDATGHVVQQLFSGQLTTGKHSISFEKEKVAMGTYFLVFETPTIRKAVRMEVVGKILMRKSVSRKL